MIGKAVLLVAALMTANSLAANWVGSTGSFTNNVNWDTGLVPGAGASATVANGGTAQFDGGAATNLAVIGLGTGSAAAAGTLEMSNGTLSSTTFTVGGNGGSGVLTMSGGKLDVLGGPGAFSVAPDNGSTGTVTMTGGTLTTANELWIGPTAGGHAYFYLNGGTVLCKSWGVVGRNSTDAHLTIDGGSWSNVVANHFTIGSAGSGSVVMSNGTLYAQNNLYVAEIAPATLDVVNGTTSAGNLIVSGNGNAVGQLTASGGAFWLNALTKNGAASSLTFSGGTLGARDGNATWSAPLMVTNTGTGYLTLYGANQAGVARINTFSGLISGSGALVVDDAPGQVANGTVVLGANNTYSGGTTLKGANTLQLGTGGTTGWIRDPLALIGGGNLAFNHSDLVSNTLAISGTGGSIIQNGSGTLVLTNTASIFNAAVANAGVLRFSELLAIPGTGASVTINNGGAVAVAGAYTTVTDWLNSGRIATASSGSLALTGDSSEAIDLTTAGGGLYTSLALGAIGNYTYSGILTPLGGVNRFGGGGGTLTVAGSIPSGKVVIGGGPGSVVLDAGNTFPEGITVSSGVLQVNNSMVATGGILIQETGMVQVGAGGSITGLITNNARHATSTGPTAGLAFKGPGSFTHTGDVVGSGEVAVIGGGTLRLSTPGQTISQSELWVGNNGSAGNLEMSGGTVNVTNWLVVARGAQSGTSQSTFTLSGGLLNKSGAGATIVGDINASVGTMVMSNNAVFNAAGGNVAISTGNGTGTLNVYSGLLDQTANDFIVANGNGIGTVNLYGGVVSNSAGSVLLGYGAGSKGTLTITNGVLYSKKNLNIGQLAGATGTLNLSNGTVTAGIMLVGQSGNGTVNQTGGTVSMIAGLIDWRLGDAATGLGTYNLQGGTLDTPYNFQIGAYGRGTLLQTGGTFNSSGGFPVVGRYVGGIGFYTLSGGVFNQLVNKLIVGEQGTGTFTVNGSGLAEMSGGLQLSGGAGPQGVGTVNLETGGTINTPIIMKSSGSSATFNFDGGTLRARGNNATIANFMGGLTLASVKAGGAVIDSSNNFVTVAQNLMSGASSDGGLTKRGTGTLTLAGVNSYNGVTTISNGSLKLGNANAITNTGAIRVAGGIYDLGGFTVTNGAVTLDSGSIINGTLNATSYELTGSGSVYAKLGGNASLTKSGPGDVCLFGANAYTGETHIDAGTLRVNNLSASLAHRWSFNNDMNDSVGGRTAVRYGTTTPTLSSTQVTLAGGGRGTSWIDLGANILPTDNSPVTIELWATQNAVQNWSRIFDFGSSQANNLLMSWTQGTDINKDQLRFVTPAGDAKIDNQFKPYTLGTQFHISVVITPNGSGSTITAYKMDAAGNTLAMGSFNDNSSLTNLVQNNMWLGRSEYGDNDASASYNEVRIWNGALTQQQLAENSISGPDALPTGVEDGLPTGTQVVLAAAGTLDLSGTSQTLAGLSGSGLVTNGTLAVTGTVAPGGTNVIGTLTLAASVSLSGTLLTDVALDGTSDCLTVQGSLDLTGMTLQVQNPDLLQGDKQYVIARCTPGALTGPFASTNLDATPWYLKYNNALGEVRLLKHQGTIIIVR